MDTRRNISCAIMIASSDPVRARVAVTSGIKVLKTPYHAKRPNAICERFLGSVRRACLDHVLILHEKQLHRVLRVYVKYFNEARPHQGIRQQVPQGEVTSVPPDQRGDRIISVPVLGGGRSPLCHQISVVIESSRFRC